MLVLTHYFGIAVAGAYAFGIRLIEAPMSLIMSALRQVLFQRAGEMQHQGLGLSQLFVKTTAGLFALGFLPALFLGICAPDLFSWVFGAQWRAAGEFARYLVIWLLFTFCNLPAVLFARLIRIQRAVFVYNVVLLLVRVAALVVGGLYLTALQTVAIFSVIGGLMNLVLILLVGRALVRREGQMRLPSLRGRLPRCGQSRTAGRHRRGSGTSYGVRLHVRSVGADNLHVVEPMVTRTRKFLAKIGPLKAAYHGVRGRIMADLSVRSPELLSRLRYREAWGRWPDLENPTTFDEKLLWLNLHWHHPLKVECGDKYTMRGYVEREGLGHLLPRAYGVYDSVDAIDFRSLPDRFVLKCTHGAKSNVFCHNKTELDVDRARQDLRRWMATDFSKLYGEAHYAR